MVLRDIGKMLLGVSLMTFILVIARLVLIAKSYPVGFDLLGILKIWAVWILLWLLITGSGFVLLAVKRP